MTKELDQQLETLGGLEDALLAKEASEAEQLAQLQMQLTAKNDAAKNGDPINLDAEQTLVQTLIDKMNARLGAPASVPAVAPTTPAS